MGERLSDKQEKFGFSRSTLRLWGIILLALGIMSKGILQTRVLGVSTGTSEQLMQVLDQSGGMAAAATALVLEAMESCAVPVFAVLLLEGFQKTKSFRNYFLRIGAVALISEIPYNYAISARFWEPSSRNPVFGLLICLIALYLYRYYAGMEPAKVLTKILVGTAAILWALMFRVEYGVMMVIVVTVLWCFRNRPALRYFLGAAAAVCCCVGNPLVMFAPFGFLLVHFYNGEEGITNRTLQYALYPLLLVLSGAAGFLLF